MLHEVGAEAFGFIDEECLQGGPLGESLAALPHAGRVVAILPAGMSAADLADFGSGGVAAGDEARQLADLIRDRIDERPDHICVFESPTARVGDPRAQESTFFAVADRVYPFVSSRSRHEEIVRSARTTHGYPSIGVVSAVEPGHELPTPGSSQTERFLANLVERAQVVIIGAYDAESWLVWYPAGDDAAT